MARGDRLAVERKLAGTTLQYTHVGIDLGDGTVVHARPDDPERMFAGGRVMRVGLPEFAAGSGVRVVSDPPAAFPPEEIAARALQALGRDGYCPVIDNCEHFATWCATGQRMSRQADILLNRLGNAAARVAAVVSARVAAGTAERIAVRTALGTTVRLGLRTLVPAALAAEAAAMAAEWTAHQAGRSEKESRVAGESAGLATSACVCAAAGAPGGPAGMVAGALAGAAVWAGGSAAVSLAGRLRGSPQGPG